jgi:hypothetical protein
MLKLGREALRHFQDRLLRSTLHFGCITNDLLLHVDRLSPKRYSGLLFQEFPKSNRRLIVSFRIQPHACIATGWYLKLTWYLKRLTTSAIHAPSQMQHPSHGRMNPSHPERSPSLPQRLY